MKSFLEKTKLIAETLTAVLPLAKLALVAAGVLGLVMVVRYNGQQDEMDRYIAQYKEYKAQAEATSKFADSLQVQINIQENETRAALSRAEVASRNSIIAQQKLTIETQDTQINELNTALNSKDVSLKLALQRGDSLQTVLNLLPPPPKNPNRMLGFKLPSRKVSFLIGVGMGLGTSLLVIK